MSRSANHFFTGAGASGPANYIEDVFSTFLYTGTDGAQTITNGIDLSTNGGLVWGKSRSGTQNHRLYDTARGSSFSLISNATSAQSNQGTNACAFNTNGFSLSAASGIVGSSGFGGPNYVSWTFRKQSKFFDIVTWTGNGTGNREIPHNLGSTPGCIIFKSSSNGGTNWFVYHRGLSTPDYRYMYLQDTAAAGTSGENLWNVTSTTFRASSTLDANNNGLTYVAYLFAHDAGGFGATGNENVISCGSFTGNPATINLGWEPQFLLWRPITSANWSMIDSMRAFDSGGYRDLIPNSSGAEAGYATYVQANATGFTQTATSSDSIYIAIRRGPMKVPTVGTSVFSATIATTNIQASTELPSAGFPVDLHIGDWRNGSFGAYATDRLRGGRYNLLFSNGVESSSLFAFDSMTNVKGTGNFESSSNPFVFWQFRRAPSFFDEVCYTGTGAIRTISHNLTVAPEWIIVKKRSASASWYVYVASLGASKEMILDLTLAEQSDGADLWNSTNPTSSVFTLGADATVNQSSATYVAYLFATCAGVSKIGSYTGTATTKQIDCGFTTGARFILIKRTDSTGDWYVWDSVRGIIAGNDPYLLLNSTATEVTNTDYIDSYSPGFELSSTAPAALNANGGTYIFLAIA